LANGDKKFCRRCQKTKALKAFFDKTLKGGISGYGRYCLQCKIGWVRQMKLASPLGKSSVPGAFNRQLDVEEQSRP
jgi:hypothetical protein